VDDDAPGSPESQTPDARLICEELDMGAVKGRSRSGLGIGCDEGDFAFE
jgi:hypothetical protein